MGLKAFFDDLAGDANKLKLLGLGPNQLAEFQALAQAAEAPESRRSWIVAEPVGDAHRTLLSQIGVVHSAYRDGGRINRPTSLRRVNGEIWVSSYYQRIARFDDNWSYLGWWTGVYGADFAAGQFQYVHDFAVDVANDRLFLALRAAHRVMALRLSDGTLLWTWGDGTPGDYGAGQPNEPMSLDLLPNGNLVVAVFRGNGDGGGTKSQGYVAEIDAATGAPVACRLQQITSGQPWDGEVYHPAWVRVLNGRLYVALHYLDGGLVAVFDPGTWDYIESYTKPSGWDVHSINPYGLCLDDPDEAAATELVVAANAPKTLVGLGLADHDYRWHVGSQRWDDRSGARNEPGEMQDIRGVLPLGGGLFAVADYGNNRITVVPKYNQVQVPYAVTVPADYRLVADTLPDGFDPATNTLMVKLSDLGTVGPLYLPIERA